MSGRRLEVPAAVRGHDAQASVTATPDLSGPTKQVIQPVLGTPRDTDPPDPY